MSERGRRVFDRYVLSHLHNPNLLALPVGTHVFNLTTMAADWKVPTREVVDEVGPLAAAIASARKR